MTKIKVKNIITKSNLPLGNYSVNPYVGCPHACKYCYASFMKRFTNHLEPWGEFLDIKFWDKIPNVNKYEGKEFFIGSVTDPYNPYEEKYKRTRAFLEEFKNVDVKISILTKSDLILRDLELIKSFPNARVGFSVNTLDENFKQDMDKAVSIEKRLKAMEIFHNAKVKTVCFISPIFPEITDVKAIVEKVQDKCDFFWLENLNLRGDYKVVILNYIKTKYPNLVQLYDEIYNKGKNDYWENLDKDLRLFATAKGFKYVINDDSIGKSPNEKPTMVNFFYHEKIKKSARK